MNTYEVKFIIKDHYQYTGEDITDYEYINPFDEGEYTEAENAAEALQIVIEQIAEWYEYNGSMVVNYGGNHILLINPYDEYTEYCRGIAIPISA